MAVAQEEKEVFGSRAMSRAAADGRAGVGHSSSSSQGILRTYTPSFNCVGEKVEKFKNVGLDVKSKVQPNSAVSSDALDGSVQLSADDIGPKAIRRCKLVDLHCLSLSSRTWIFPQLWCRTAWFWTVCTTFWHTLV